MSTGDHSIEIAVDSDHIAGTLIRPQALVPGVLLVHGWGGSQQQYLARAREIAALGCICLTFDLRGHARSQPRQATVTREENLRDVLAAYDELVNHPGVDAGSMAIVGSSYGGYLAAIASTMRPVSWLALRVPAVYKDSGWNLPKKQLNQDPELHAYRRRRLRPQENRALRACLAFRGDALIIESEHDDTVPHPVIESYVDACKNAHSLTYRVISGADHGLSDQASQRAYTSVLVNWLTEMLFGAREGGVIARGSAHAGAAVREAEPQPG
jgi:pimeloyl-ACP methyl ester carboxylesterase